jgi:hypothetical protein
VRQAVEHLPLERLLADSGYDSENNHQLCHEELGIRSTVTAVNDRYYKGGPLPQSGEKTLSQTQVSPAMAD